jgi:hypothetical protein
MHKSRFHALRVASIVFLAVIASAVYPGSARAADSTAVTIADIRVGFAGHYKLGCWTPVELLLSAGGRDVRGDLEVVVPDGDGVPTRVVERGVAIKANEKTWSRVYAKFGRPHAAVTVTFRSTDGANIAERTFSGDEVPVALGAGSKSGAAKLVLELGSQLDLGSSIRFSDEGEPEETAVAYVDDPAQLPDRWDGYDGVDLVVLTTSKPKFYRRLSAPVLDALDRWLHLGGRMVISVGKNGPELLPAGMPLSRIAPGRFVKTISTRRFAALESFAGTDISVGNDADRPGLQIAMLTNVRGRVEASEGSPPDEAPLVIRSIVGFGETTFVTADLDEPALSRWKARPEFIAALLGKRSAGALSPAAEVKGQGTHYGYDDMIGQLRAALNQFPDVRFVPFWLIATLAGGYILLLFPLDYLLGRRRHGPETGPNSVQHGPETGHNDGSAARGTLGRSATTALPAWPWVRFVALVALVSLGACLFGLRWKGDRLQGNQADVIDIDVASGLARGQSWFGLYSPSSQRFTVALHPIWSGPHGEPVETQLSWLGLPGSGLGGMNAPATEMPLFREPYDLSDTTGVASGVPLATWSSKCFSGRWTAPNCRLISADLHENVDRQLAGSIRLADGVQGGFKLTRCALFYDRWAYPIDALSAVDPIDVARLESRTAETLLTERHLVSESDQSNPYDRAGLDRARVLQIMMFYKIAGGRKYTGLLNRYEHELDFSDLLAPGLGRAVLVGLGPPAANVDIDGHPLPSDASAEHLSIYRFVIPVEKPADRSGS